MSQEVGRVYLKDVQTSGAPIGPGMFPVEVTKCELKQGKNAPHNPYLGMELTVIDHEEFNGRKLFFNVGLTENSLWALKGSLLALGFDESSVDDEEGLDVNEIIEEVVGQQAVAEVQLRPYNGEERDNVKRLLPYGADAVDMLP